MLRKACVSFIKVRPRPQISVTCSFTQYCIFPFPFSLEEEFQLKIAGVLGGLSTNRKKRWNRGDEHVDPEASKGSNLSFFVTEFSIFSCRCSKDDFD